MQYADASTTATQSTLVSNTDGMARLNERYWWAMYALLIRRTEDPRHRLEHHQYPITGFEILRRRVRRISLDDRVARIA